jgi:hypothetical protein
VFGKYDYPKTINYYLGSEFDFCAIDVEFTLEQCLSNDTVLPVLPSIDCANGEPPTPCVPLPVTCQEKLDFIAPVRDTCFIPSLAFETGNDSDFNALSSTQKSDLGLRICTVPTLPQYTMSFDGVNESINCYDNAAYNFTNLQPFTITSWVKSNNYAGSYQGIMTKRSGAAGGTGWTLFFLNGDLYCLLQSGIFYINMRTNGVTFTNSAWCHIAFTVSGSGTAAGIKFYRNGVQLPTIPMQDNLNATISNTSPVIIGGETALAMPFNGNIGYSRLFNIELSGAQVVTDYNSGTMLETSPQIANQVLGWKSGQGALFGTPLANYWLFPNELDSMQLAPFSLNMLQPNLTTDIPV